MNAKTMHLAFVVCLLLCLTFALVSLDASAQNPPPKKNIAEQTGLGTKEIDKDRLPGKLEIGLAIGSVVLMIGVLKWS